MHKKGALDVAQMTLRFTVKQCCTNNALDAGGVSARLSGKQALTVPIVVDTGSSSGLRRAVRSGFYTNYQATVRSNSTASRIIGSINPHQPDLIVLQSVI